MVNIEKLKEYENILEETAKTYIIFTSTLGEDSLFLTYIDMLEAFLLDCLGLNEDQAESFCLFTALSRMNILAPLLPEQIGYRDELREKFYKNLKEDNIQELMENGLHFDLGACS